MTDTGNLSYNNESLGNWDPLGTDPDPGVMIAAQRREIRNILRSYTGYYDVFAELIQNSLDAVEKRVREDVSVDYTPQIWIKIDMKNQSVSITDNGYGMNISQFRQFMRPNFSFKDGGASRGNKGVGATYLAYGFNYLEVATKYDNKTYSGLLRRGREWVEDRTEAITRPLVEDKAVSHEPFHGIDRGTSMTVRLVGNNIRPKNLAWIGATTSDQWLAILRAYTPLGGIYLCQESVPNIMIEVEVVNPDQEVTVSKLEMPRYLFPHEVISKTVDLRELLRWQKDRLKQGQPADRIPPKFRGLNGIWGEWTGEEILKQGDSPITIRLEDNEQRLVRELSLKLYIFMAFSTDLWDHYNDTLLGIRKGYRVLQGGLQLATRHMPQGALLTIPMTNNIGFQNLAHVIIHFENAEPDLGRKGFQPDVVRVSEKISVSAVTAFRKRYNLLRKPGAAKEFGDELALNRWIKFQEKHEEEYPLIISGRGLYMPTEELAIRSEPLVEQDVVALFNQMLTSGIVRGIHLVASSQYQQYDGLYRIKMQSPFDKYIHSETNPLGVDAENFTGREELETPLKILEYKYTLDGLIEEIQGGVKDSNDIGLVVVWEMGEKWNSLFNIISYLDEDNTHHRKIHGTTHSFTHSMSGIHAFEAIVLKDLVDYLRNPFEESERQKRAYSSDVI